MSVYCSWIYDLQLAGGMSGSHDTWYSTDMGYSVRVTGRFTVELRGQGYGQGTPGTKEGSLYKSVSRRAPPP